MGSDSEPIHRIKADQTLQEIDKKYPGFVHVSIHDSMLSILDTRILTHLEFFSHYSICLANDIYFWVCSMYTCINRTHLLDLSYFDNQLMFVFINYCHNNVLMFFMSVKLETFVIEISTSDIP